jgi:hypothetical protein
MQKQIKAPLTFHDKDIVSLSRNRNILEVSIGEDDHGGNGVRYY